MCYSDPGGISNYFDVVTARDALSWDVLGTIDLRPRAFLASGPTSLVTGAWKSKAIMSKRDLYKLSHLTSLPGI